jgi:hypothetical protein
MCGKLAMKANRFMQPTPTGFANLTYFFSRSR